jgi:predicted  nucleic acid-binding Zn-ribbon protein
MSAARDEIEALRAEVRRLRATVQALTDNKKDLEERLAFLAQELERTRFTATGIVKTS